MWPQSDMITMIAVTVALTLYASFWHHPFTMKRYHFKGGNQRHLYVGSMKLSGEITTKIMKSHSRIRSISYNAHLTLYIGIVVVFGVTACMNGALNASFINIIIFAILWIFAIWYLVYGKHFRRRRRFHPRRAWTWPFQASLFGPLGDGDGDWDGISIIQLIIFHSIFRPDSICNFGIVLDTNPSKFIACWSQ